MRPVSLFWLLDVSLHFKPTDNIHILLPCNYICSFVCTFLYLAYFINSSSSWMVLTGTIRAPKFSMDLW
jgi:hypothetical protein